MENKNSLDLISFALYILIALVGLISVYSATAEPQAVPLLESRFGKQAIWFGISIVAGVFIFLLNSTFFEIFSWHFYTFVIILLILVLIIGSERAGSRSWIALGPFSIQPAEFAKFGTTLAVASFLSRIDVSMSNIKHVAIALAIVFLPAALIVVQGDAGSALVYSSFVLVMYREGLTSVILVLGLIAIFIFVMTMVLGVVWFSVGLLVLGVVFYAFTYSNKKLLKPTIIAFIVSLLFSMSVSFLFSEVLQEHQQKRILVTLNLLEDPLDAGYNVEQSKIAIGSGGFTGKGLLNGSHTKGNFIPEQETDFIFCTIGEEGGWIGSTLTVTLFVLLILRLLYLSTRAKKKYKRIFIFSIASILFFHLVVNVGMTIGLMPVIGIPLPLISYGGSSILAFNLLLLTALKMDATRDNDLKSIYD